MGIELFSAEDREILAGHIGELQLSDALLERFLASAVKQAGDFAAANEHPEPTEAEAVAYMMRNMRIALGIHTGEDGRAKGGGFPADRLMADYAEQHRFPANLDERGDAEPIPDPLARFVPHDVEDEQRKQFLRERLQFLTHKVIAPQVFGALSEAERVEHQELERYRGYYD